MKIDYDVRATLEENLDNDISCILELFKGKDISQLSIAEIPSNKDRNIALCKYFDKVEIYDINQQVILNLKNTYQINNVKFDICDFTNVSKINVDCLISMRQSFQMFDLGMLRNFFKSLKLNNNIKYLVFDLYNFNSKDMSYAPSYLTNSCVVKSRVDNVIYLRETSFKVIENKVYLCHRYFQDNNLCFKHNIYMFNHNVKYIIHLLKEYGFKFTIYNKNFDKQFQSEYQIFFVEVL